MLVAFKGINQPMISYVSMVNGNKEARQQHVPSLAMQHGPVGKQNYNDHFAMNGAAHLYTSCSNRMIGGPEGRTSCSPEKRSSSLPRGDFKPMARCVCVCVSKFGNPQNGGGFAL